MEHPKKWGRKWWAAIGGLSLLILAGAFFVFWGGGMAREMVPARPGPSARDMAMTVNVFGHKIKGMGAGTIVAGVDSDPGLRGRVVITVTNGWHEQPQDLRRKVALTLWEMWVDVYQQYEETTGRIRIKLVDFDGNEVGGSEAAGSEIWVKD